MARKFVLPLLLIGLFAWQAPARAQGDTKKDDDKKAEEAKKWSGFWQTQHGIYKEYWQLTYNEKDAKWMIQGAYVDKKDMWAGKYIGGEPKLENGILTFTREWFQKPPGNYEDSVKITASLVGDNLQYHMKTNNVNHTYVLTKMSAPPVIGPQITDLVGVWKSGYFGLEEVIVIKPAGASALAVQATWLQGVLTKGVMVPTVGQWNPANGELKYQQVYAVSPNKSWHNGSLMTAHLLPSGHLRVHWQHLPAGGSGHRDFTLVPGTGIAKIKPPPFNPNDPTNPPPPPPPAGTADPAAFIGSFSGDNDGFKEVWTITKDDAGQWAVKGGYLKGDDEAGGFTGRNVVFNDGKLTFALEFTKQPAGTTWVNGAMFTVVPGPNNSITVTWQVAGSSGTRTLMKGR